MNTTFEIAAGSIAGREHLRLGRNNQDAYAWATVEQGVVAVVCDGCSSGTSSEVGAKLGAQWLVDAISRYLVELHPGQYPDFWERVRQDVLHQLRLCLTAMGGNLGENLREYYLFTVLGVVITPQDTWIFGVGDGVYALNGEVQAISPFANNAPPYLAYGLIENASENWFAPTDLQIKVHHYIPTFQVKSLLIGTDGVSDLMATLPLARLNTDQPDHPLEQFWLNDRYFKNPDYLRRQLSLLNREVIQPNWQTQQIQRQPGLLPDDTTLLMMRRSRIIS